MVVSVPCDMRKDSLINTFFKMNKFPKKEPINFCKFYDNEGNTQLLLQSEHFVNSTCLISCLWCKFYNQYSSNNILSEGDLILVNVPCDIRKD